MATRRPTTIAVLSCGLLAAITFGTPATTSVEAQGVGVTPNPGFPRQLPGSAVKQGSVTIANIVGDSKSEIIVGGSDGVVYALSGAGQILWQFRTDTALNNAWGGRDTATRINSAPAVGDITGDGVPEIVVAVGGVTSENENGGVVALNNQGQLMPGWPQLTVDEYDPRGITEGVKSSPIIADFTGDGVPEIGYGAFDQRIYLKDRNGRDLPGWPYFARDTVWSSPAAVDLNNDGVSEMVIGIDAHNDPTFGDRDGGYLLGFRGNGQIVPGWRIHQDDIITSSPAVADLDGDGKPEIIVGAGNYFALTTRNPNIGRTVTAYRTDGTILWRQRTDGTVGNAPAIGDVNGDGQLDVVIVADDGDDKAYAFNGRTGALLWKQLPRSIFSGDRANGNVILGDYDGNDIDDVFVPIGNQVAILRGRDGQMLTGTTNPPTAPVYYGDGTQEGTPALGDVNGDGKFELVTAMNKVYAWTLPNSTRASWPMFRQNPAHSGVFETPSLDPSITSLDILSRPTVRRTYRISFGTDWTVRESDPNNTISFNRTSGGPNDSLQLTVQAPRPVGDYKASVVASSPSAPSVTIPITVRVVNQTRNVYLPLIRR